MPERHFPFPFCMSHLRRSSRSVGPRGFPELLRRIFAPQIPQASLRLEEAARSETPRSRSATWKRHREALSITARPEKTELLLIGHYAKYSDWPLYYPLEIRVSDSDHSPTAIG